MISDCARRFLSRFVEAEARLVSLAVVVAILFIRTATAQPTLPRFEQGDCLIPQPAGVRLDCGYVIAAESRGRSKDQTVRLAVAIYHPPQSSKGPPIVMLHGGPGGNGLRSLLPQKAAAWAIAFGRDVVVYDQRGSGLSAPALCPDVVKEARAQPPEELAGECLTSLKQARVDPTAYNTDNNAADAVDIRKALGYRSWIVYGESYGSRLALELARRDTGAVSALVLTSPLPPGPGFYAESLFNFQQALHKVFARCTAQPECARAFPTLESDFYALYNELSAQPLAVQLDGGTTVQLDGRRFVQGIRRQFANESTLVRVPLLINELRRENRDRAARTLSAFGERLNPANSLIVTQDVCGPALSSAAEAVRTKLREPFRWELATMKDCRAWQSGIDQSSRPSLSLPVRNDVPALIFAGEWDDRTPIEYGRQIASGFRSSHVHEIPGRTHGWSLGTCEDEMVRQFLANPRGRLDASCIAKEPGTIFETRGLELQRLVFTISDANPASSAAGVWEAWVPGPQIVTTIELQITGDSIAGAIVQPRNKTPIIEGRFERGVVLFKATSANGDRTLSLRGTISGGEIHFVRDLTVRPGGDPGGEGIFGIRGPQTFTVKRRN